MLAVVIIAAVVVAVVASRSGGASESSTPLVSVPTTPQGFTDAMMRVVGAQLPELGRAGRILVVAHAAKESGWGGRGQNRETSNNVFDITPGKSWGGPTVPGSDTDAQGVLFTSDKRWRAYPDLEAAVADYWSFLGDLYPEARDELAGNAQPSAFAALLVIRSYRRYYDENPAAYAQSLASFAANVAHYSEAANGA